MLRQELSITDNIKLKRTKDAVQTALSMAIDRLSSIPKTPPNGLVLFCGRNVDTGEEMCLAFSPPEPVPYYYYRTDKWFHLEFLEEMVAEKEIYGLILVERDEATIGILKGSRIEVLDDFMSYIPGKHSKGGQSQRRYDRIIEQMVDDFYKRVAERARELLEPFLREGKLKGIVVGGPGYSKQDFVKGGYLDKRLQELVLNKLIDVSYQGEAGLRELVMKAEDVIQGHKYISMVKKAEELKLHMAKADGLAVFGLEEVEAASKLGALQTVLVVEDHPEIDRIYELAERSRAEIIVFPRGSPEGEWLRQSFGGVAGILRYRLY
jgi:peptide chain release factor subunit 1